jgi:hypothetical protein
VDFQKRLLRTAQRLLARGEPLIELADDSVLRDYIEENLSAKTFFLALSRRPAHAVKLVAALIR